VITSDFSGYDDHQFSFLIRRMWNDDLKLQQWAKRENKTELVKSLERDIRVLKEAERRLSERTI
jgi:hypothetical protein